MQCLFFTVVYTNYTPLCNCLFCLGLSYSQVNVSEQKEHIIDKELSDQEDLSFQFAFEQVKVRNEKPEPEEATLDGSS